MQVPAFLAVFYGTFTFVLLLLALIVYGVMGFTHNYFPSLAPLKLLRVMGSLAAGVLFIPLMEIASIALSHSNPTKMPLISRTVDACSFCTALNAIAVKLDSGRRGSLIAKARVSLPSEQWRECLHFSYCSSPLSSRHLSMITTTCLVIPLPELMDAPT
jgi:hypothetical protein